MADKTIWEYPTLTTAQPDDLILMAAAEETYNMKVQTLKDSMGEAASSPPVVRNGNWWVWDAHTERYVDSGTPATGDAAGFGSVTATVDANTGTPSVQVTASGPATAKNFAFSFHNLVGDVTPEVQSLVNEAAASASAADASADRAEEAAQTVTTRVYRYSVTVPTTGWTQGDLYSITVSVQGILSTDNLGIVDLVQSGVESTDKPMRTAYQRFVRVSAGNDAITVYSYDVPGVSIPLQISVFR